MLRMSCVVALAAFFTGVLVYSPSTAAPSAWKPAVVTAVSASGDNKGFTILATVRLRQPCYKVVIKEGPLKILPPHYVVLQQYKGGPCSDVVTTRTVKQHFNEKPMPTYVDVDALDIHGEPKDWRVPIIIETR